VTRATSWERSQNHRGYRPSVSRDPWERSHHDWVTTSTPSRTGYAAGVITAIVMVTAATDAIPEVAEAIAALDGVSEVYSVAGDVDLVAIVRVREFDQVADVIAGHLDKVPGVLDTSTHIAFRAYSRHDLEAAFAIGFD
jgi:DNA-binding Lrp family transcriptional regulator